MASGWSEQRLKLDVESENERWSLIGKTNVGLESPWSFGKRQDTDQAKRKSNRRIWKEIGSRDRPGLKLFLHESAV